MYIPDNISFEKSSDKVIITQKNIKDKSEYLDGVKYLLLLSTVLIIFVTISEKYIFFLLLIPLFIFAINDIMKKRVIKIIIKDNILSKEEENKIDSLTIGNKSKNKQAKFSTYILGSIDSIDSIELIELNGKYYLSLVEEENDKLITFSFDRDSIVFIKKIIESYMESEKAL